MQHGLKYGVMKIARRGCVKEAYSLSDSLSQIGTLVERWNCPLPWPYEGDQTLLMGWYIIHTADSRWTLQLLLNGEEKMFISGLAAHY
jgi:hypothetical protein